MSTSLLYHGFGVRGYRLAKTEFLGGEVVFTIEQERTADSCSSCGSRAVIRRGSQSRMFRSVPIGKKPTKIFFAVPRVECQKCGVVRQVRLGFADERRRYTRALERYVLELSRRMTIQDVANHLQLGWDTVKDIQKRHLTHQFARPRLKELKELAIDEISIGKGHRYVTLVLDLESGAVVYVGQGKGESSLKPFWKRLKAARAKVRAVATDMGWAYIAAVRKHLPKAVHVLDHFHVIKLFNTKLSVFRRSLYHELTDKLQKKVLKGTRWLLLKNPENLQPNRNEQKRLAEALQLNAPLATVYYMKEDLRQLWQQPNKAAARAALRDWTRRADVSGISVLQSFASLLALHRSSVLAYYDYPISTGPLEGTNNKIKTMKRQAYGFRDQEFFKLKIMALHQTKYALVG